MDDKDQDQDLLGADLLPDAVGYSTTVPREREMVVHVPAETARTAEIAGLSALAVVMLVSAAATIYCFISSRRRQQSLEKIADALGDEDGDDRRNSNNSGNSNNNRGTSSQQPRRACCLCCRPDVLLEAIWLSKQTQSHGQCKKRSIEDSLGLLEEGIRRQDSWERRLKKSRRSSPATDSSHNSSAKQRHDQHLSRHHLRHHQHNHNRHAKHRRSSKHRKSKREKKRKDNADEDVCLTKDRMEQAGGDWAYYESRWPYGCERYEPVLCPVLPSFDSNQSAGHKESGAVRGPFYQHGNVQPPWQHRAADRKRLPECRHHSDGRPALYQTKDPRISLYADADRSRTADYQNRNNKTTVYRNVYDAQRSEHQPGNKGSSFYRNVDNTIPTGYQHRSDKPSSHRNAGSSRQASQYRLYTDGQHTNGPGEYHTTLSGYAPRYYNNVAHRQNDLVTHEKPAASRYHTGSAHRQDQVPTHGVGASGRLYLPQHQSGVLYNNSQHPWPQCYVQPATEPPSYQQSYPHCQDISYDPARVDSYGRLNVSQNYNCEDSGVSSYPSQTLPPATHTPHHPAPSLTPTSDHGAMAGTFPVPVAASNVQGSSGADTQSGGGAATPRTLPKVAADNIASACHAIANSFSRKSRPQHKPVVGTAAPDTPPGAARSVPDSAADSEASSSSSSDSESESESRFNTRRRVLAGPIPWLRSLGRRTSRALRGRRGGRGGAGGEGGHGETKPLLDACSAESEDSQTGAGVAECVGTHGDADTGRSLAPCPDSENNETCRESSLQPSIEPPPPFATDKHVVSTSDTSLARRVGPRRRRRFTLPRVGKKDGGYKTMATQKWCEQQNSLREAPLESQVSSLDSDVSLRSQLGPPASTSTPTDRKPEASTEDPSGALQVPRRATPDPLLLDRPDDSFDESDKDADTPYSLAGQCCPADSDRDRDGCSESSPESRDLISFESEDDGASFGPFLSGPPGAPLSARAGKHSTSVVARPKMGDPDTNYPTTIASAKPPEPAKTPDVSGQTRRSLEKGALPLRNNPPWTFSGAAGETGFSRTEWSGDGHSDPTPLLSWSVPSKPDPKKVSRDCGWKLASDDKAFSDTAADDLFFSLRINNKNLHGGERAGNDSPRDATVDDEREPVRRRLFGMDETFCSLKENGSSGVLSDKDRARQIMRERKRRRRIMTDLSPSVM